MTVDQDKPEEVICSCSGTTEEKIKALVASGRAANLDQISRITGACSGCGACDSTIQELLDGLLDAGCSSIADTRQT